jgi:hypothetical protein
MKKKEGIKKKKKEREKVRKVCCIYKIHMYEKESRERRVTWLSITSWAA